MWRNGSWFLRNGKSSGIADNTITYGLSTDVPVMGDWNGDGLVTPGVFRNGTWYLRTATRPASPTGSSTTASPTTGPSSVTRDADNVDTVGVFRSGAWYITNDDASGVAQTSFDYGVSGDLPLTWEEIVSATSSPTESPTPTPAESPTPTP